MKFATTSQKKEVRQWKVQSDTSPTIYVVKKEGEKWTCECLGYRYYGRCKHIDRKKVELARQEHFGSDRPVKLRQVLGRLKDFQLRTVNYVFKRLYLDPHPASRFLVADEVGLGKTLVACGIIAKTIEYLRSKQSQINIVYICSNSDIARQNISRLNVTSQPDFALASRITLLPLKVKEFKRNPLNFVSLTPGTSFELQDRFGRTDERALLYHIFTKAWGLRGPAVAKIFEGAAKTGFKNSIAEYKGYAIDRTLLQSFKAALKRQCRQERESGQMDLRSRLRYLCRRVNNAGGKLNDALYRECSEIVGDLRIALAASNLEALEPDLIILDEFQRFKNLLDIQNRDKNEACRLASKLFNYFEENKKVRVLLLSATPYKMLTLDNEPSGDDHYQDFLFTLNFLSEGAAEDPSVVAKLLQNYRTTLIHGDERDLSSLQQARASLEKNLRRIMVRTEKLGVSKDRKGMLEPVHTEPKIELQDIRAYLAYQCLAREMGQADTIEFWKSAPYLINFMEAYAFKRAFCAAAGKESGLKSFISSGRKDAPLFLPWKEIETYTAIEPANHRLRSLLESTVGCGTWNLLWLPPSLPYYQLGQPFDTPEAKAFTKRLVFSSWRVVPKVIATMLSYDAERRMALADGSRGGYSADDRKRRGGLLRFARAKGKRLTGLPLFTLIYPCVTFAKKCDPLQLMADAKDRSLANILARAEAGIKTMLQDIQVPRKEGLPDETWYWLAPFLLDQRYEKDWVRWLARKELASAWSCDNDPEIEEFEKTHWDDHLDYVRNILNEIVPLGPQPKDLGLVLAQMAVAGPGTAALRSLWRVTGGLQTELEPKVMDAAASVGWSFRNLFNLPDVISLIRSISKAEPYWRRVLEYCAAGCLQSVLDEYVHVLKEMCGLLDNPPAEAADTISGVVRRALALRRVRLGVHEIIPQTASYNIVARMMRCRYALRYGEESQEDGVTRPDQVRQAFNSPFWPFVLATTSVGQEGLDFHPYCHAVVHWNLPPNPVDFEQREGRVHRYKGHAVRKNLASRFGPALKSPSGSDPWQALFDTARSQRKGEDSDLVPYWVCEGPSKIERHVLFAPLSKEEDRLARLRRSLVVYRMVFGQPSQEDLIRYLLAHIPEASLEAILQEARIDLTPP